MLFIVSLNATRWVNIRVITYRLQCHSYSISQEICTRFFVLCFVVVMQSFIMNSHKVFIHIHQGCFAGTGAIVRLPQCQWSKPDVYGKISQCITTTKHSKAKTVCIFLGIYCTSALVKLSDSIVLTHLDRDTVAAIYQTTFQMHFCNEMYEFRLRFHCNLLLSFELTVFQHWFR